MLSKYKIFLLTFCLLTPVAGLAFDPQQASIKDTLGNEAWINYRQIDGETSFICNTITLLCRGATTTDSLLPASFTEQLAIVSPSGRLVVSADRNGLLLHQLAGGQITATTILPFSGQFSRLWFIKDESEIAIFNGTQITYLRTSDGTPVRAASARGARTTYAVLSPDGRYLAWYEPAVLSVGRRLHRLLDTQTGQIYSQTSTVDYWDLLSEKLRLFTFSPDSRQLVYLDDRDGYPSLYRVSLGGPSVSMAGTRLITRPYSVTDFIFENNSTLLFVANRENHAIWSLYSYNLNNWNLDKLADHIAYSAPMRQIGDQVAFYQHQGNVLGVSLYQPSSKRISTLSPIVSARSQAELVRNIQSRQFANVPGTLLLPDNYNPNQAYPLIVWLHGGPYRQASHGYHSYFSYAMYDWWLELLRQQGYLVAKIDYRGSFGHGRRYAESLKGQVGKGDVADVLQALGAIKHSYTVSNDVYLMGNSYGGYLALRTLVERPNQFKGAISVSGVSDWHRLLTNAPTSIFGVHFGGAPNQNNLTLYQQAAINTRLNNLSSQKILLVHGQSDTSVSFSQSSLLFSTLLSQGKTADLVTFPEENHVFHGQDNIEDSCRRVLEFFNRDYTACNLKR
jgi:acetyl esterase/lipase